MKKIVTIPTIVGVLLLVVGVILGVYGISQGQIWFLKASPEEQPKEVRITNVSDKAFTVSWITDTDVRGFVKYGTAGGSLPDVVVDERDTDQSQQGLFQTHFVTVAGLSSDTDYEFKIGSGKRLYDDSGKAFVIKTAPVVQGGLSGSDLISGSVVRSDSSPASGAIVYFDSQSLSPLSTLVKSSGVFTIPLTEARSKDLKSVYAGAAEGELFELLIDDVGGGRATAVVNMANRDVVPPIKIPGDYDYSEVFPRDQSGTIILPEITPGSVATEEANLQVSPTPIPASKFTFQNLPTPTESDEITFVYPAPKETINVTQPEFQGTATPGKTLTITVESTPQSGQVTTDADGNWSWTPPAGLAPGEHTVTISYVDKTGNLQKLVRLFTVSALAAEGTGGGGELAFTATPSATLAPSPTVALTPTVVLTATPTSSATPTLRAALPATEAGVPVSGSVEVTILLSVLGLILTGAGVLVLRGAKNV